VSQEWSRVGRNGLGEPEVERGSQKWIGGARSGAGEPEMYWGVRSGVEESEDWRSQEWLACNWYLP